MRGRDSDSLQVTLRREWGALSRTAETRRAAASRILHTCFPLCREGPGELTFWSRRTMGKMLDAIRTDVTLRSTRNPVHLMERALMWLHEQEVIRLNRGLTVFRPAMTIRLANDRRQFTASDFAPLNMHYDEQTRTGPYHGPLCAGRPRVDG